MIRLSHSALEKYKACPQMYKLHYIDKIREEQIGSPLFFGLAIDEALNELLKTKMPTNKEPILDPVKVFMRNMHVIEYNNEKIKMPFTLKTRYSTADYDEDLIDIEKAAKLQVYLVENCYENENPLEVMKQIQKVIKAHGFLKLDETDKLFYNYACWLSLIEKGLMMLKAYENKLLPQIEEVISIQRKVNLPNQDGDYIIGYIDFEAKLVNKKGIYTSDDKTSSRPYKEDSVKESQQLCVYDEFTKNGLGAFFVLNKKVRKTKEQTCLKCRTITFGREKTCKVGGTGKNRCNGNFSIKIICSIDTQLITDKISEEFKDLTFDSISDILIRIRENDFPKVPKEDCFQYGRKCPYSGRCYGKDRNCLKGLVNLRGKK